MRRVTFHAMYLANPLGCVFSLHFHLYLPFYLALLLSTHISSSFNLCAVLPLVSPHCHAIMPWYIPYPARIPAAATLNYGTISNNFFPSVSTGCTDTSIGISAYTPFVWARGSGLGASSSFPPFLLSSFPPFLLSSFPPFPFPFPLVPLTRRGFAPGPSQIHPLRDSLAPSDIQNPDMYRYVPPPCRGGHRCRCDWNFRLQFIFFATFTYNLSPAVDALGKMLDMVYHGHIAIIQWSGVCSSSFQDGQDGTESWIRLVPPHKTADLWGVSSGIFIFKFNQSRLPSKSEYNTNTPAMAMPPIKAT
jgi:hypothetical protein